MLMYKLRQIYQSADFLIPAVIAFMQNIELEIKFAEGNA